MLDLNDCYYFVKVVDHAGFSAAARTLDVPKSRLSRRLGLLEDGLGVRLLHRTSRRIALTDAGEAFYRHASAMLIEAEAAEQAVLDRLGEPAGTVRVACSIAVAQFVLADILPSFMARHPKITIIQDATNRYVDPIGEGFDIVLRAHEGPLPDSSLIQKRLAIVPWALFASPVFIKQIGAPLSPKELENVPALLLGSATESTWTLRHSANGHPHAKIAISAHFASNDMYSLKRAAIDGLGVTALPHYICKPELETGHLQRVLPEWIVAEPQISLLIPSRRGQMPAVSALVEELSVRFAERVTV